MAGFWEALNAGGPNVTQRDIDNVYQRGRDQGHLDLYPQLKFLGELVLAESATAIGQRFLLTEALRELEKLDPGHWLLDRENRSRIAHEVREVALKHAGKGIGSPNGFIYRRRSDGFIDKRDFQDEEVVGMARELEGKATALTYEDIGLVMPEDSPLSVALTERKAMDAERIRLMQLCDPVAAEVDKRKAELVEAKATLQKWTDDLAKHQTKGTLGKLFSSDGESEIKYQIGVAEKKVKSATEALKQAEDVALAKFKEVEPQVIEMERKIAEIDGIITQIRQRMQREDEIRIEHGKLLAEKLKALE